MSDDSGLTFGGTTFNPQDEPAYSLTPGTMLKGGYQLIERIGSGGMGVVWSAYELTAERKVALKFVPHEVKNFAVAVAQLKASFQKIHALQDRHICPVYTLEEDPSFGYYHVMKWLDGETLDKYILRTVGPQQPLPLEEVVRILHPVAEALDYAHGERIIHRDIKPSNIFLVLDEEKAIQDVQVIDFGIAAEIRSSLTRRTQILFDISGTRPYMAPEQWEASPQSAATDQYALGVVAYELLSGHLPFMSDDYSILKDAVLNKTPKRIREMPEYVNVALLKALAKDEDGRFGSCREFIAALGGDKPSVPSEREQPGKINKADVEIVDQKPRTRKKRRVSIPLVLIGGSIGLHRFYHGSYGWGIVHWFLLVAVIASASISNEHRSLNSYEGTRLRDNLYEDAKNYIKRHFHERVSKSFPNHSVDQYTVYLDAFLNNYHSYNLRGGSVGSGWTQGGMPIPETEVRQMQTLLEELRDEGIRQSDSYRKWQDGSSSYNYRGGYYRSYETLLGLSVCLGVTLGIFCVVDLLRYMFMGKARYDAFYNQAPPHAFKW